MKNLFTSVSVSGNLAKFVCKYETMQNVIPEVDVHQDLQQLKEGVEQQKFDYSKENLEKMSALQVFSYGKFGKLFEKYPTPKGVPRTNYNVRAYFVSEQLVLKGKIKFPKGANPYVEGADIPKEDNPFDDVQNSKYAYCGLGVQNSIVKKWLIENHNTITDSGEYIGK